jgi:hypothetical protein|tara:strand:+ start:1672 stop:1938 length:267 start_codon:yes stop_codon:yes gene_type:complete
MKLPKYLGMRVAINVTLVSEDKLAMFIDMPVYDEAGGFIGTFREEFQTSMDVVGTLIATLKSGRQDIHNQTGLELKEMQPAHEGRVKE